MYLFKAIEKLRPGAELTVNDNDYSTAIWHKLEGNPPTQEEIDATIELIKQEETQAKTNAAASKALLLARLGITEDEAKLLLS